MIRKKGIDTQWKILVAAIKVFTEQGFQAAKVSEICALAGTNIASVNYHFGGKEKLYQEAWAHAFSQAIEKHPLNGGVPPDAPAKERLRGHITSLVHRICDPETKDIIIAQLELLNPSGLLDDVMRLAFDPMRDYLLRIVSELLGESATPEEIQHCEMCIMSLCVHPMVMHRYAKRAGKKNTPHASLNIDRFIESIFTFAMAAIRAMRSKRLSADRAEG